MKSIYKPNLLDLLPDSIKQDPKLRASAEALSTQLELLSAATWEVLHLPRLDDLTGTILDYLAEQFHIDFYEPLYLTETEKKNLIRESIAWHRIKGTAAAVEKIAHDAFTDADVVEWFEYEGGKPFHFKIRSHGYKQTPDGFKTYLRMINAAKNTRSWVDNFEVIYDEPTAQVFAGVAEAYSGVEKILPASPVDTYESKISGANSNLIYGGKTIGLHRPDRFLTAKSRVANVLSKVGEIKIGTATAPHDTDDVISRTWLGKIFAGMSNGVFGKKFWSLARPKNQSAKIHAGSATATFGEIKIAPSTIMKIGQRAESSVANVLVKAGNVKINSATQPSSTDNTIAKSWQSDIHAGNANHVGGQITLTNKPRRLSRKTVVRVGMPLVQTGEITIGASTDSWIKFVFPTKDNCLQVWFNYPNHTYKKFSVPNVRDDLSEADVQNFIDTVIQNKIFTNDDGQAVTGTTLAALLKQGKLYFI